MKSAVLKAEIASALGGGFGSVFRLREKPAPRLLSTGIREVDELAGGLPRGAITEVYGPASSGRSTLLYSILAEATARQEVCALVDTSDTLDPASAAAAGIDFRQLLWVRCAASKRHALRVTDLLLQAGGFGLVALDLGDIASQDARRIPLSAWFRFRRAIEHTPTAFVVIGREPYTATCASLLLEMQKKSAAWSGTLLGGAVLQVAPRKVAPRKPVRSATACFEASALG